MRGVFPYLALQSNCILTFKDNLLTTQITNQVIYRQHKEGLVSDIALSTCETVMENHVWCGIERHSRAEKHLHLKSLMQCRYVRFP